MYRLGLNFSDILGGNCFAKQIALQYIPTPVPAYGIGADTYEYSLKQNNIPH